MKTLKIRKKSGGFRFVVVPDDETKITLRSMVGTLAAKCHSEYAHGFRPHHSPVTNAIAHVGHRYTISMDLADFFDSVTPERVANRLSRAEQDACIIDPGDGRRRACQGLPTSPAVANLAGEAIDTAIATMIRRHKMGVIYTRYADDLTFSFDDFSYREIIMREVPQIVARCGFRVQGRKTRLQDAVYGRREITGITVGDEDIRAPRRIRRRLRAAQWRAEHAESQSQRRHAAQSVRGLSEWAKLKPPKPAAIAPVLIARPDEAVQHERESIARTLAAHWAIHVPENIPPGTEIADGDYIITRDPAYVLGMSTYTTGWTSCMAQPRGQYRAGVGLWAGLAGTSVAAMLSQRTMCHAGVIRRVMRARCLVHHFRSGHKAYDRCYGDPASSGALRAWLETHGYVPMDRITRGECVIGNVLRSQCRSPYFDSLRARKMIARRKAVWVIAK